MDGFSDITFSYDGSDYVVPADRVFELVREVEHTLMAGGSTPAFALLLANRVPYSTLAAAYAQSLRFAGADVSGSKVYLEIMQDFAGDSAAAAVKVQNAVIGLLQVISPPMALEITQDGASETDPEK